MAARLSRLVVALALTVGAALPSPAAAAGVRLPTSHELAASSVPDRGADSAYARSYFGARYYRAGIGRFTTVDPVIAQDQALADPQLWNRYAYVRNNPLRYTDPDGDFPVAVAAAVPGPQQLIVIGGLVVAGGYVVYRERDRIASSLTAAWTAFASTVKEGVDAASTWWAVRKGASEPDDPKAVERKVNPSKQDSPVWNDLENASGGRRTSGRGAEKRYYEWDHTHNDIEVYDNRGRHLGTMDPNTGDMTKPPVPGRTIKI